MTVMTEKSASSSGLIGRLIALVLAVLLALLGYWIWQNTIVNAPPEPIQAETLTEIGVPEAVTACIDERQREIDQLVADGMVSEAWAEESRNQARALCYQRN
jgi:cytoskeletal protein RodZ